MPTVDTLIKEIKAALSANGSSSEQVSVLLNDITSSDTTLNALISGSTLSLSEGPVEIDDELLYLSSVDLNTGVCTVAPGIGRGWSGTVAAAHSANAMITSSPRLPRADAVSALNMVLADLWPDLFAVKWASATSDGTSYTFEVDADSAFVLMAEWRRNESCQWEPVKAWRLDKPQVDGDPALIHLDQMPANGVLLRFATAVPPISFSAPEDDVTVCGVPVPVQSLLVTGALLKVTPSADLDRLDVSTVEQSDRSRIVPASAGLTASRYLQLVYQQQLQDARRALRAKFPIKVHRSF